MENNAVVKEILKIGIQWEQLKQAHPQAVLFCWEGSRSEIEFVDAFIRYQMSEDAAGKDVFLLFNTAFEDVFGYGKSMLREFEKAIQAWHDDLNTDQQKRKAKWTLEEGWEKGSDAACFVANINTLPDYYELFSNEKLVFVLSPETVYDMDHFNRWLVSLTDQKTDPRIKFMIHDRQPFPLLKKTSKKRSVVLVKPAIDAMAAMMAAHRETSKEKDDPDALFQKHLLVASALLGKNKTEQALKETQKCIAIAQKNERMDTLASVYAFRSTVFSFLKDKKRTLKEITTAIAYSDHNPRLKLQNILLKGSYALRYKDRQLAYDCLKETPPIAKELNDVFLVIETNRLYGLAAGSIHHDAEAWNAYRVAFDTFKEMEPPQAKASTFPLAGKQMMHLCAQFGYDRTQLFKEIAAIAGPDWWQSLQSPQKARKNRLHPTPH